MLQDIAGKDVMDQFETIMRKHKLNPVSSNPMKLFQARKRAKRALKTAVGALQGDWDESQIIHVSSRPWCTRFRPAAHCRLQREHCRHLRGIWELCL